MISVILADSQYLIRVGLRHLVSKDREIKVIAECSTGSELIAKTIELTPDVVILDYQNSGHFQLANVEELYRVCPQIRVIVISSDDNKSNIHKALEYGVQSYLTKECDEDEIRSAIVATSKNQKFFCNKILDILLEKHHPKQQEDCLPTGLTARELEVVKLVVDGISSKEIADRLHLSHHTVYTHRKNVMKKLSINSTPELVRYAITTGLVDPI